MSAFYSFRPQKIESMISLQGFLIFFSVFDRMSERSEKLPFRNESSVPLERLQKSDYKSRI
ncbi:hypothetical protein [Leptospira santarosai]|uniref:Uncharacterized protein n=1 Tax=Leptospira santarosai TaxID=28183 RepID=A0AB73MPS3_9LEPT|nr:hypothetical protein [Leptospira santarosai]ASV13222.1 hypothetical protein B2G51_07805 [Leptospira santarosai]EMO32683.1 hypothetical protein LEP1GSC175_2227 [Leptospira santarosai str. HAI821]MBW9232122.1 hypothetical protein [Leptospira santarosai]MDO6382235.1 hypothetical protein [Leptospira santarosai]ONF91883.1 hypothetical protein BWD14_15375 [Leptospira santarosai]